MPKQDELQINIIRTARGTIALELKPDGLLVRAPRHMSEKDIYAFVEEKRNWIEKHQKKLQERKQLLDQNPPYTEAEIRSLAKKALEVIPQKVQYYAPIVGVDYGRITIRNQRTLWGSCSSKGNLNFNCLLMLMPEEVIDSVVVHELCHRKHMNHSAEFYAEVRRVFPEYDRWNRWLKENGGLFLSRLPKVFMMIMFIIELGNFRC